VSSKPIKASPELLVALKAQYNQGMEKYIGMLDALKPSRRDVVMQRHGRKKIWLSELRSRIVAVEAALGGRRS
jgi:hypothetical protein